MNELLFNCNCHTYSMYSYFLPNFSVAMVSNFQIFVVGIPVLIILGANPISGYFVRVIIVWMNDLVVVCLIFGNLMYSVHFVPVDSSRTSQSMVHSAIEQFTKNKNDRKSSSRNLRMSSILKLGEKGDKTADAIKRVELPLKPGGDIVISSDGRSSEPSSLPSTSANYTSSTASPPQENICGGIQEDCVNENDGIKECSIVSA